MTFSERHGFTIPKTAIQRDSMDDDLRNSLWNALDIYFLPEKSDSLSKTVMGNTYMIEGSKIHMLMFLIWISYFKKPIDTMSLDWSRTRKEIRGYFFSCNHYEVFDFIEFVNNKQRKKDFEEYCNNILEKELSAFRFVDGKLAEITSKEEIGAIESAIEDTTKIRPVNEHIRQALSLFADRKSPDYRNSIKESISAVESLCKRITGDENATLGEALKKIEDKIEIHPALKGAFHQIYGYTCNEGGLRHCLLEAPNISSEDAKFMLVSCSAFINYLLAKASKAGIKLK